MQTKTNNIDPHEQPWGVFFQVGKNKLLLRLVKIGFGHGNIKKMIQQNWDTKQGSCVDINYRGIKLRCFIGTNNIEGKILFSSRLREKEELEILKPYIINGGTFIDVGANIGYYSLMAAKLGANKVISFEPNNILLRRFEYNRNINNFKNKISIEPIALGAESGNSTMTISENDLGTGTLLDVSTTGNIIKVKVDRIDEFLAKRRIKSIDALKIDVEGYEFEVLSPLLNCPDTLLPKLIIIEHAHAKLWEANIIDLLILRGYSQIGKNRSNTFLSLCVES